MKRLRQLHLYLGTLFAPLLIFFAGSGAWQLFGLHQNAKDGSYTAPSSLVALAAIHKHSHLPGTPNKADAPLRWFSLAASIGLIVTTALGIAMAFRFTTSWPPVALCLAAGALGPVVLLWIYH